MDAQGCAEPPGQECHNTPWGNPCPSGVCHIRAAVVAQKAESMRRNEALALGKITIDRSPLSVLQELERSVSYTRDGAVIKMDDYTRKLIRDCIAFHTGGDTDLTKVEPAGLQPQTVVYNRGGVVVPHPDFPGQSRKLP